MLWTTPIWLLGLLPWAAVTLLLLMARRPRRDIPFLQLWKIEMPREAHRRKFTPPPIAVILALIAALLGILAAAGPALRGRGSGLTVVVDAGATMSARGESRERYVELLSAVATELQQHAGNELPIRLIVIPDAGRDERLTNAGAMDSAVAAIHPSAAETAERTTLSARQALATFEEPVLVVSDRPLNLPTARLQQVAPERPIRDVGIQSFAIRRSPKPQAMVRLSSIGAAPAEKTATLRVSSGGKTTDTTVELPAGGATRDVFVNLPAAGSTASTELIGIQDDFSGNDRADLIAETDWPIIEPIAPIGELSRLVQLYSSRRPPGEQSKHVRLSASEPPLKGAAGFILPAAGTPATPTHVASVANHPVTSAVTDWNRLALPAAADRKPPGGGWIILLADEHGPLLAARDVGAESGADHPNRQLWTAISVSGWANVPQYVVFWSAAFDWLGQAETGDRLAMAPLVELSPQWQWVEGAAGGADAGFWPGVYERSGDGARRAFRPCGGDGADDPTHRGGAIGAN